MSAAGRSGGLVFTPLFDPPFRVGDGRDERWVQRVGVRLGDDDELLEQRERVLGDVLLNSLAGEPAEVVVAGGGRPFCPSGDGVVEGNERAEEDDLRYERH